MLLRRHSRGENGRMEIYKVLHEQTRNDYTEANNITNLSNAAIEFIEASELNTPELTEDIKTVLWDSVQYANLHHVENN